MLRNLKWVIVFSLLTACVDRITFEVPTGEKFLVVEGSITDQRGPYTVRVTRSFTTDEAAYSGQEEPGARVSLYADDVLLEELVETDPGVYKTVSARGIVGRSYHIVVETKDGRTYRSERELMRPVGALTDIRAEFEARKILTTEGEKNGDRFNIYVDGNITSEPESYVRWRFTGTYLLRTNPEFAYGFFMGVRVPTPYECSGYGATATGIYYIKPCTCCTCWVTEPDDRWFVGKNSDVTEAGYKDVFVGQANVNSLTFIERYHVNVDQMSLSPEAYEFFRQLEAQTQGVESLFQPSTGEIRGNISAADPDETVLGFFYASSVKSISMDLRRRDVPYDVPPPDTLRSPCTGYRGSSNVQPDFW